MSQHRLEGFPRRVSAQIYDIIFIMTEPDFFKTSCIPVVAKHTCIGFGAPTVSIAT